MSAQPTIRVIKKTVDAYTTLRSNLRNGRYGKPGSKQRLAVESKPITFRPDAAQPFDDRCLSWQIPDLGNEGTVSIWTTAGRMQGIRFRGSEQHVAMLRAHRKGESDLVFRDGKWFLVATCDIPTPAVVEPDGFLGVDLGIVNIAYTSTGRSWSGAAVTFRRKKNVYLRARLRAKGSVNGHGSGSPNGPNSTTASQDQSRKPRRSRRGKLTA